MLNASKNQSLIVGETRNAQERRKHKCKEKRNTEFQQKDEFDHQMKPHALGRTNIKRENALTVRKVTIQISIV